MNKENQNYGKNLKLSVKIGDEGKKERFGSEGVEVKGIGEKINGKEFRIRDKEGKIKTYKANFVIEEGWFADKVNKIELLDENGTELSKEEQESLDPKIEGLEWRFKGWAFTAVGLTAAISCLWYALKSSEEEAEEESL